MDETPHINSHAPKAGVIDLRSDAVTRPTEAMWEAMRRAPLGWAFVGEDPSVNELQDFAADFTGKEAALFVPTGTMANLLALMAHTQRGDQIIAEAFSHILWAEEWSFAYICGLVPRAIHGDLGYPAPEKVRQAITEERFGHRPRTRLICLENTHNMAGGTIISRPQIAALARIAREYEIPIHVDGARILNASVALQEDLRALVADVDTLTFSLNKGLSAPVGALLCGPESFIARSRSNVRRLGGWSMHKAGICAAAGLVALQTMIPQLAEDNRRAKMLERGLGSLNTTRITPKPVQTNIVMISVDRSFTSARSLLDQLAGYGIIASLCSEDLIRFVTHRHIADEDIRRVISIIGDISGYC